MNDSLSVCLNYMAETAVPGLTFLSARAKEFRPYLCLFGMALFKFLISW